METGKSPLNIFACKSIKIGYVILSIEIQLK